MLIDVGGPSPLRAAPFLRQTVLNYLSKLAERKPANITLRNSSLISLAVKWVPWSEVIVYGIASWPALRCSLAWVPEPRLGVARESKKYRYTGNRGKGDQLGCAL